MALNDLWLSKAMLDAIRSIANLCSSNSISLRKAFSIFLYTSSWITSASGVNVASNSS